MIGEPRHHTRHVHGVQRHRADRHGTADHVGDLVDGGLGISYGSKSRPGVREQRDAGLGQPDIAARAGQQRLTDQPFEAPDLSTDRGLGHPLPFCRLGETAFLDDRGEIFELT